MTPQQTEALKLALGQLQAGFVGNAMQILREALAEHAMRETQRLGQEIEQAPYSVQQAYAMAQVCLDLHEAIGCKWGDNVYFAIDQLKAVAQPPQRTEQEPVAWMDADGNVSDNNDHKCFPIPLYTQPPQRTWVGLTDEQIWDAYMKAPVDIDCHVSDLHKFARAIEAAHGIKGEA